MSDIKTSRVLQEQPEAFDLDGGTLGVLLLHGFAGTAREMRPLGEFLHAQQFTVSVPLLPGHGATLEHMNRHGWRDWTAGVLSAYESLARRCEKVFVAGFSMGALLALWLAAQRTQIMRLALCSPALRAADWRIYLAPLVRYFLPGLPRDLKTSDLRDPGAEDWLGGFAYDPIPAIAELLALQREVRRIIPQVKSPALVIYSTGDRAIHPQSGPKTVERLSHYIEVEQVVLQDSGHSILLDQEKQRVFEEILRFFEE